MVIYGSKASRFHLIFLFNRLVEEDSGWLSIDVWKLLEQSMGKPVSQRFRVSLRCRLWRRTARASILESSRNGSWWTLLDLTYFCHSVLLWFPCLDIQISLAVWMDSKRIMLQELVLALQAVRRCVKAMLSLLFADRLQELKCSEKSMPTCQKHHKDSQLMYSAPSKLYIDVYRHMSHIV